MKTEGKFTLLLALSAICICSCSLHTAKIEVKRYDLEHHFAPSNFNDFLATRTTAPFIDSKGVKFEREDIESGFPLDEPVLGTQYTARQLLTDLGEERIKMMDEAGIDVAFLSHSTGLYDLPKDECIYWAAIHNDSLANYAARYPERIRPTMTLPAMYVEEAVAEMQRCYDMGFRVWFIDSNFGPKFKRIYDPMYEPLLAKASDLGVTLYIHPGIPTEPTLLDNGLSYSEPGLGFGQDVMKTVLRLTLTGTFDRYPKLRVVVGHYGEFLPFTMDRIDHMLVAVPNPLYTCKHNFDWYIRHHNLMFTSSGNLDTRVFECTCNQVGYSNIMFGSDYPYELYKEAAETIDTLSMPFKQKKAYWQDNIEKYILNGSGNWDDVVSERASLQKEKMTPSVKGYDFEHHYYIPAFFDALAERKEAPRYNKDTRLLEMHTNMGFVNTPEFMAMLDDFGSDRMAVIDDVGIGMAVMSSSEGPVELDNKTAIELCRASNDSVYAMSQRYPGRISGEMTLPVNDIKASIAEMHRCYDMGFRVWCCASHFCTSDTTATYIYEPKYEPLLAEANELGLAIYVHPQVSADSDSQDFGYPYNAAILGFTVNVMRTVVRLVLNGTLDRYPDIRIIVPHVGEYLPFVLTRMDNRFSALHDPFVKNKKSFSEYINEHRILISLSGMVSKEAFDLAKKVIGVDGMVYASDYPYENYKDMVDFFLRMDMTQEELDKIWGGNAEKYIFNK